MFVVSILSQSGTIWAMLAATLHFTVRTEQPHIWGCNTSKGGNTTPFIGIVAFSHKCCRWLLSSHQQWSERYIYSAWEMYTSCVCVITGCLSEEETSAAAARKRSTSLRKCSVRERAGINPASCAVSVTFFFPGNPAVFVHWHEKRQEGMFESVWHQGRKVSIRRFSLGRPSPYLDPCGNVTEFSL